MAYIERAVEESVPELESGRLLKRHEIKQILKQRVHFAEHKFKYTSLDFLRYLEYEHKLLRLLKLRGQLRPDLSEDAMASIERRQVRRLLGAHRMSLSRHGHCRQLWLLAFECAKRHSEVSSRSLFLRALMLHPKWTEAWLEAARYEYQWHANGSNARMLLQRAIDVNPKSAHLYIAFFAMEVEVVCKHLAQNLDTLQEADEAEAAQNDGGVGDVEMDKENTDESEQTDEHFTEDSSDSHKSDIGSKKKKSTIGEAVPGDDAKTDETVVDFEIDDDDFDWAEHLHKIKAADGSVDDAMNATEKTRKEWLFSVYSEMQLPKLILKHAMARLSLADRYRVFGQLLKSIPKERSADNPQGVDERIVARFDRLVSFMFDHIAEEFASKQSDCVALDIVATRNLCLSGSRVGQQCVALEVSGAAVFLQHLAHLKKCKDSVTECKVLRYFVCHYLKSRIEAVDRDENVLYLKSLSIRALKRLEKLKQLTTADCRYLAELQTTKKSLKTVQKCLDAAKYKTRGASKKSEKAEAELWLLYVRLLQQSMEFEKAIEACKRAIDEVTTDSHLLWSAMADVMAAKRIADGSVSIGKIEAVYRRGILRTSHESLKLDYVTWAVASFEKKQQIAAMIRWFEAESVAISQRCYKRLFEMCDRLQIGCLQLFERAIADFGHQSSDVWIAIIAFARKNLSARKASIYHQRALKTLNATAVSQFHIKYSLSISK